MNRKEFSNLTTLTHRVSRYVAYCTFIAAHGGVAPSRNGTTIPRRRALPYTAMNAHYTSFNYSF